jgi:hypothetical protein
VRPELSGQENAGQKRETPKIPTSFDREEKHMWVISKQYDIAHVWQMNVSTISKWPAAVSNLFAGRK